MPAETEQTIRIGATVHRGFLQDPLDLQPAPAEQIVFTSSADADADHHAKAWQALADRHPVLRVRIRQDAGGERIPFCADSCVVRPNFHDWRDEPDENTRNEKLKQFLCAERPAGFGSEVSLFRVAMIRWNDDSWRTVLTFGRHMLDWRSISMLVRELAVIVSASSVQGAGNGSPELLPRLRRDGLQRPAEQAADETFWREYLRDLNAVNPFDIMKADDHAGDSAVEACIEQRLNHPSSNGVRCLQKAADVTLNNIAEAAWALLISRYSASTDVVFGIMRSCRRSASLEYGDALGYFTNVIPLRVRIDESANVFDLLWQVRDQHRLVREHECSDLASIRASVQCDGGELSLHSVLEFDLRDPVSALNELFPDTGPRDFSHHAGPHGGVHLQVHAEDEIVLRLKYDPQLLDPQAAERLLDQYGRMLTAMAEGPHAAVRDLDYLDDNDKAPIRWPGARRFTVLDKTRSIHGSFEDRVAANPDAVAIACGDVAMTYAELNAAANRLAHRLRRNGVKPDTLVGVCIDRSIDQVIGILGVLKSGAGYLPLDPSYPEERLSFLLQDAGVDTVVVADDCRDRLASRALTRLSPHGFEEEEPPENPEPLGSGQDLAYVIYTSGSTGQPKGVMVTHHNVVRLFDTCADWLQAGTGDTWTMFHSFAFDFSVWEIWGALLHGGRLEIVPRDITRSPEAFHQLLIERNVTVLSQTPSAFQQLMRVDAEKHAAKPALALRLVVFGGEKLDLRSLENWIQRHGDTSPQLVNMYGITETTVHVTCRRITARDAEAATSSLIGWPLPDLYIRLLDAYRRPVPPGTRGEICVGGAGVTRGYLNRPDLNAHKFIRDPLKPGARLYCSGDFARQTPDGELAYLGRDDDQVKIRGFRIDLGEISNTLQAIDGIESAIVIPRETRDGTKRLVAYYVETEYGGMPEARLRDALSKRLPEHMVPAVLIRLAQIPVNANNKTDFKALPDPSDIATETLPGIDLPETSVERTLAEIWSDVLERPHISRSDDFFGLGGDSILALQVISRARAAGLEISPRDLFEHSALSALADVTRYASTSEPDEEIDVNMDGPLELSPIQHWFFDQKFERPQHFNQASLFKLPPDIDVDLLEQACLDVVRHHDALHLRFTRDEHGRRQAQTVKAEEALEFSRIELDHLDEEERKEAIALITEDIQRSLSISSGLLMRAAYFTGGPETGDRLMIAIHQLAADTASWGIILQDIDAVYRALAANEQPRLPARTMPYAQWTARLKRHANAQSVAGERAYWDRIDGSVNDVPLVAVAANDNHTGYEKDARVHTVALAAPETRALLGDIHQAYGTDVTELLVSGLARAVAELWPASRCMRMDIERRGRDFLPGGVDISADLSADLSRSVGWFNTLHPVALDLRASHASGNDSGRNQGRLICDVKTRLRSAPHKGIGWGMLRYLRTKGTRTGVRNSPLLFRYLGQVERLLSTGILQHLAEQPGPAHAPENHLAHPLTVTGAIHDDRLEFEFRYDSSAVKRKDVEALAGRYVHALEMIVRHCQTREGIARAPVDFPLAHLTQDELDDFPVDLRDAEDILPLSPIQRLYHTWSGTDRDIGFDQWVFRLEGHIDEAAFEAGWRELLQRHEALRTVFVDEGLAEPHQVVLREVKFRVQRSDWRLLDRALQDQRLDEFLAADRKQGFRMDLAPLTRVTLIRAGEQEWIMIWSHHMAQVDGWSWPVIAEELGELHDAHIASRSPELQPAGSYRSYISWLMDRDRAEYAQFWRRHLGSQASGRNGDKANRTLITRSRRQSDGSSGAVLKGHETLELSESLGNAIGQLARKLRLTPSAVFQGAWALLLSALTQRFSVTLGVAFSGRTAGIPVPAHTIGPFVNDLPVNVQVNPESRIDHWLAGLRTVQADINHYQNVSPLEIHEWTGTPASHRFFDTLMVFQNYATGSAASRWGGNIRVQRFTPGVVTNYPLAIAITPGKKGSGQYRVDLVHDRAMIDSASVIALGKDLETVLRLLSAAPDVRVSTILNHLSGTTGSRKISPPVETPSDRRWGRRTTDSGREQTQIAPRPPTTPSQRAAMFDARNATGTEETVAAICRHVLGIASLDVNRNFLESGAQSVSLLEIHDRIQRALTRTFPIVKLFQHPTIAALSRYLDVGDAVDTGETGKTPQAGGQRAVQRRAALQRRQPRQPGRFDNPS